MYRTILAVAATLIALAGIAQAQTDTVTSAPAHDSSVRELSAAGTDAKEEEEGFGGGGLLIGLPVGEFANFVDPSGGLGVFGVYKLDQRGISGLRFDGSYIVYGSERRRLPLSQTLPFVEVDVNTENTIVSLFAGPQLTIPAGVVRPYLNAGVGFSYFATTTSVGGSGEIPSLGSTTHFDDFTFAWAGGGGLWIRLTKKVFLDLSGHYLRNGRARYLREGSINEAAGGSHSPIESETNVFLLQVGVSIALGKDDEDVEPKW